MTNSVDTPQLQENDVVDVRDSKPVRKSFIFRLATKPSAIVGVSWVFIVVFAAVFANWIMPHDPLLRNIPAALQTPSWEYWLGTDQLGRDLLSRIIFGAGDTMMGALISIVVALVIGVPLGILAGYYGGWIDNITSRVGDLLQTIPAIIVLLAVLTLYGNSIQLAMLALGVLMSSQFIRLARSATVTLREELFVDAARVFGVSDFRILMRHIFPNMAGSLIVQASIVVSVALLFQASLGFLGLGTVPPFPSWGRLVAEASGQIYSAPWLMVPTGLVIIITIYAFNLIGDAARDTLVASDVTSIMDSGGIAKKKRTSKLARGTKAAKGEEYGSGLQPTAAIALDNRRTEDLAYDTTALRIPAVVSPTVAGESYLPELPVAGALMSIRDLVVTFPLGGGKTVDVVQGVGFDIPKGKATGLVGESGSGKTMTALSALGLVPSPGYISNGTIFFDGQDLVAGGEKGYQNIRGKRIGLISQEPMVALDPSFKVSTHMREMLQGNMGMTRKQADERALELLNLVEMRNPEAVYKSYPHQLSGGMAQRVSIAWALAGTPDLLIADEPTTALDVTVQAGILDLLRKLMDELGMTILLLTHDLGVVADLCSQVVVMQNGLIVER
ncbi:MAG: dipeptide/oligopeptide/nickel ABC transporter permease/ATP-binding protein, partial [Microbacteriaceae bacterium]